MINTTDISKNFILNKAIHDATNILLRPYRPLIVPESCTTPNSYDNKCEVINQIREKCMSHSRDFLLKMAAIAWDFLNILTMFQNNLASQIIEEDMLDNEI